jgi:hypothetical protein
MPFWRRTPVLRLSRHLQVKTLRTTTHKHEVVVGVDGDGVVEELGTHVVEDERLRVVWRLTDFVGFGFTITCPVFVMVTLLVIPMRLLVLLP